MFNRWGDLLLSFAVFFQVVVLMGQLLLIDSHVIDYESIGYAGAIIVAIPFVPAMYWILIRRLRLFLFSYIILLSLIVVTILFFPSNKQYIELEVFYLLAVNVPCFLSISSIREITNLKRVLISLSYIVFILGILYYVLLWNGIIEYSSYSMPFSNYLLLPALVFVYQRTFLHTILFIVICIMMILLGSRGAFVAAFTYAISLALIDRRNRRNIILGLSVLVIISGSIFYLYNFLLDKMIVSSRTIDLFLQGDFAKSPARIYIYTTIWQSILDMPLIGHGIYGDRVILNGDYCHNLILELYNNFGIIIGTGLILYILYKAITLFKNVEIETQKLLLLLFCYGIIPLFFSSSYLKSAGFGIFIGSMVSFSKMISELE